MKDKKQQPEMNEEQAAEKAQEAVNSYTSDEIAAILSKNEGEAREWLTGFGTWMASQNPQEPLPPRP